MSHKRAIEGVRRLVQTLGGKCWVLSQSGRLYGSAGIPDCYCVIDPVVALSGMVDRKPPQPGCWAFWVEVKVGKDKLSPAQAEFKQWAESAGVEVLVGDARDVAYRLGVGPATERQRQSNHGDTETRRKAKEKA